MGYKDMLTLLSFADKQTYGNLLLIVMMIMAVNLLTYFMSLELHKQGVDTGYITNFYNELLKQYTSISKVRWSLPQPLPTSFLSSTYTFVFNSLKTQIGLPTFIDTTWNPRSSLCRLALIWTKTTPFTIRGTDSQRQMLTMIATEVRCIVLLRCRNQ